MKKKLLTKTILLIACLALQSGIIYSQIGKAVHFDAVNDRVYVGNSTAFNTPHITVQTWIKMDNTSGYYGVVTKRNCCVDLTDFQWSMQTSPNSLMSWAVNIGGSNLCATGDPNPVTPGVWINYTGTYDGNVICFYRNGILVSTNQGVGSILAMNWPVYIGARDGGTDWFPGAIDEVRIWNYALTQQEILDNINCHLSGTEPGLIAYYDFNQGIDGGNNAGEDTLFDLTSNGLNGALQNFSLSGNTSNWIGSFFTDSSVTIISQPSNQNLSVGDSTIFIVASSNQNVTYQWQTDSAGSGFHNISDSGIYSGTATDTLHVNGVSLDNNNQQFRCVVSSPGYCQAISSAAILTVSSLANQWLHFPTAVTTEWINIGSLSVSGDHITVEALVSIDPFCVDIVSKHGGPSDNNYLLRPFSFELTTTNGFTQLLNPTPLCLDSVYHVAGTYDGDSVKYFVNGNEVASTHATGNLIQNSFNARIGNHASGPLNEQFYGYIDEVRIWNVARTDSELVNNMYDLQNPSSQAGLLAYYKFNGNFNNVQGDIAWNGIPNGSILSLDSNSYFNGSVSNNFCSSVGLAAVDKSADAILFPNPSDGKFEIDFGKSAEEIMHSILIRDVLSQIIYETKTVQQKFEIDLNGIVEPGIYFLEVLDKNNFKIAERKIIITSRH